MCQYALPNGNNDMFDLGKIDHPPVRVFDAHNAVWTIIDRIKQTAPFYLRIPLFLELRRIKKHEATIVTNFEKTLTVTEPDRLALIEAVKEFKPSHSSETLPISVIPIAVDTKMLSPIEREERSRNILTLGTLHYHPNADGIRWFANEVYPIIQSEIPNVTLTIIGKNPPKDLLYLASQNPKAIQVTGYVPDLDPYLKKAGVLVVPVRVGGGMRVRILESFSRSMPVVTTTIGLEGIDAQPGRDVLVADEAQDFANSVIQILNNQNFQNELALNGRLFVETTYDWQVVLQKLNKVYNDIQPNKFELRHPV
jgi:glycosyltransferase involved in cell wall biosynthesis